MRYIKCEWLHGSPEYPVLLYSELDAERYETRKVEVYADGRTGYASSTSTAMGTELGECAVPEVSAINADPQFRCSEISAVEFEAVWRTSGGGGSA